MFIVSIIRITRLQEIKFWVILFILLDALFEFRTISRDETGSFVDDIWERQFVRKCNLWLSTYFSVQEEDK